MRKLIISTFALLVSGFLIGNLFTPQNTIANEETKNTSYIVGEIFDKANLKQSKDDSKDYKTYILDFKQADVTGDFKKDNIILIGDKFSEDDIFSSNITIVVEDGKTKKLSEATYDFFSGYFPKVSIGDVSGDKINDVMVSSATGGSAGVVEHLIASFADNKSKVLFSYEENSGLDITGEFKDNFIAELNSKKLNKDFTVDISSKKQMYIDANIYDENSKLLSSITCYSSPFSKLEFKDYDFDGTFELIGTQRVVGAANSDTVTTIETIWKFEKNKLQLKSANYTTFLLDY